MKVLKVLRARPELFFRLSGVRLADFETLVARLYPVWLLREEKRLSRKADSGRLAAAENISWRLQSKCFCV